MVLPGDVDVQREVPLLPAGDVVRVLLVRDPVVNPEKAVETYGNQTQVATQSRKKKVLVIPTLCFFF